MAEEPNCELRRRRLSGNPNLALNLEGGYQVTEGGPSQGTPSPGCIKLVPNDRSASAAMLEFRKKQQSFDIQEIQIEECDEEEIIVDSDDEGDENGATGVDRPITPTPIQDFSASVVYTEGPHTTDFLKVRAIDNDCVTDVSEADSDEEE